MSGYYVNQALTDGTKISKPENGMKCSHGGIVDSDMFKTATGGINKDSGYYLFSPHADLHLAAANLAIEHTEYFFNEIRSTIGEDEYLKFMQIYAKDDILNYINQFLPFCSASNTMHYSALKMFAITSFYCLLIYLIFVKI